MLRPRTQGALRQSLFTSVFSPVFSSVFGGAGAAPTPVDPYAIRDRAGELILDRAGSTITLRSV